MVIGKKNRGFWWLFLDSGFSFFLSFPRCLFSSIVLFVNYIYLWCLRLLVCIYLFICYKMVYWQLSKYTWFIIMCMVYTIMLMRSTFMAGMAMDYVLYYPSPYLKLEIISIFKFAFEFLSVWVLTLALVLESMNM